MEFATGMNKTGIAVATVAAAWLAATATVRADFITPTGVSASSFYSYAVPVLRTIDDATVTSASSSLALGTAFWHAGTGYDGAAAGVVANQYLIFTLPGTYNLTQADLWQMNQSGQFPRGIRQYDLLVSSDGVNFTEVVSNAELAQATGAVTAQTPSLVASNVRFVKLKIDTAWSGATNEFVGLNEARFEGSLVSAGPLRTTASATTAAGLPQQPSSIDLLQGKVGSSSLGLAAGSMGMLTDGIGTNSLAHRVIGSDSSSNWVLTYNAASLGLLDYQSLSINKINVFGYNTDARRVSSFDVEYTLDGINWKYLFIGADNATTASAVTLTSLAKADLSEMVTDVRGLRFTFRPVWVSVRQSSLIEIDVFGTVLVPAPAALPAGLALMALAAVRRRRTMP